MNDIDSPKHSSSCRTDQMIDLFSIGPFSSPHSHTFRADAAHYESNTNMITYRHALCYSCKDMTFVFISHVYANVTSEMF